MSRVRAPRPDGWSPGPVQLGDVCVQVEFRDVSPYLQPPLRIRRAQDVSMGAFGGERYSRPGFRRAVGDPVSRRRKMRH